MVSYGHNQTGPTGREVKKMKLTKRELYIDGKYSILYGFDWENNEAIYRQVCNGAVVYVRVPLEK